MRQRSTRKGATKPAPSTVCYCDGKREVGTLELYCAVCRKWFHGRCLKDLTDFYGLPFMVCYVFNCADCSPTKKETWTPKQANFAHMCVTVLANLTHNARTKRASTGNESDDNDQELIFLNLENEIIPYFNAQWENLTSMSRRVKNTWHQTLQKSLTKETELFESSDDGQIFALRELDLSSIGPGHEALKQIGRSKPLVSSLARDLSKENFDRSDDLADGPKTRGSSKRRYVDPPNTFKKAKLTADYASTRIIGISAPIDFPFNREGYRYYLVEKDLIVPNRDIFELEESTYNKPIPAHIYRVVVHPLVTLSPNDRAYQLKLSEDRLSVSGFEGYSVARATHSVSHGTWYFEVVFTAQPPGSHIRIGWSQALAPIQACVGYTQLSYAWRSHKGTIFHQAKGRHYSDGGFKEGDVLGCLISLPPCPADREYDFTSVENLPSSSIYLPPSYKNLPLINFKHNYFYEEKDDVSAALKSLKPAPGSWIEFYRNGKSCGIAFTDIYAGFYYPAVSLFQGATVRCNFGPSFRYPVPPGARGMCERVGEMYIEQTLADILYLVENEEELTEEAAKCTRNQ
ncbi:SPRY domain-containing protein [Loa loa]|nr:SPRY domain-containing protein [Loa loa]EJD74208.1 SPRY domain-containing protein [Loa loa]